jgi:Cu+-exporting ATPase
MSMIKYIVVAAVIVLISGGLSLPSQNHPLAETGEGHDHHQHGAQMPMKGAEVIVDLETDPASIKAGSPATIFFSVKDLDGKPLQELTITHDRLLHVIITSQDFSVFAHIHPEDLGPITPDMKKTARFPVRYTFPEAGQYLIALDSAVKDSPFSEHFSVDVTGEPRIGSMKKDFAREKRFGDYTVTLSSTPERISEGKEVILSYLIKKNGTPVNDLQPYLSAPMHIAVISADLNNFIHAHGELPGTPSAQSHGGHHHMTVPEKFGPRIETHLSFPAKGVYQIFGEVKHEGKVMLTSFMVEVE